MRTYYIYNTETDEYLGTVKACGIFEAEIKGGAKFGCDVYALTTAPGEPLA